MKKKHWLEIVSFIALIAVFVIIYRYYRIYNTYNKVHYKLIFGYLILAIPLACIFITKSKRLGIAVVTLLMLSKMISTPFIGEKIYVNYTPLNYNFPYQSHLSTQDICESIIFADYYLDDKEIYHSYKDIFLKYDEKEINKFYRLRQYEYNEIYQKEYDRVLTNDKADFLMNKYHFHHSEFIDGIDYYFYMEDDIKNIDKIVVYTDYKNDLYFFPLIIESRDLNNDKK